MCHSIVRIRCDRRTFWQMTRTKLSKSLDPSIRLTWNLEQECIMMLLRNKNDHYQQRIALNKFDFRDLEYHERYSLGSHLSSLESLKRILWWARSFLFVDNIIIHSSFSWFQANRRLGSMYQQLCTINLWESALIRYIFTNN